MSTTDRTAGEIDWPAFLDRTPASERRRTSKFSVPIGQTINELEEELVNRVGVDDWRLSTAAPHRKKDGRPSADANPDDPAAVVRWSKGGEQFAVACDHYGGRNGLRDNIRAIYLYIREKRKMSNRPVRTGQDEFATARLPPGDGEEAVVVAGDGSREDPHEVLGVAPDASEAVIKGAARSLKREHHPDRGGSTEEFQRVVEAEEAML